MKRIVICSDGTWNKPDQLDRDKRKPSNVVKTARGVLPQDSNGVAQVVFYDQGVGSSNWLMDKVLGGATGVGVSTNICDCYQFLSHNYVPGDEIYLFGFSRGAYTVRSLAGFLNRVGLLPKRNIFYLQEAFECYRNNDQGSELEKFKSDNEVFIPSIKFVGVWDTVGSLGIPLGLFQKAFGKKHAFHDTKLGQNIEHAYHALAIDEKRKPFKPTLWEKTHDDQHLEQVWFAGVHTNIGGGYENDGLANCALNWMIGNAKSHGLAFDSTFLSFYRSYAFDEMRDSFKIPFKLLGKYERVIGEVLQGNETVDDSATDRLNNHHSKGIAPYQPLNLMRYLSKRG